VSCCWLADFIASLSESFEQIDIQIPPECIITDRWLNNWKAFGIARVDFEMKLYKTFLELLKYLICRFFLPEIILLINMVILKLFFLLE